MKINILLPGNTNKPTGGYKVIYEYCNKLSSYGHDICIYYYYGPMFENLHLPEKVRRIIVKKFGETIGPGKWFKLDKKIKKKVICSSEEISNGDIVVATSISTAKDVYELPIECGKKIYFIQDFENWSYKDSEVYESYNYDMTKVVVSNWLKKIVDDNSKSQSFLVSNCINTDIFCNKYEERKPHSIVFHYKSGEYKGAKYSFEIIDILKEKFKDLSVDIISSEKKPDIVPDYCEYHYRISAEEISRINNRAQVFMCTSINEGFGLPGLEAMACGCALASFSYLGVLEYAKDGENSLLAPIKDSKKMADNIERLFLDENLRNKITKNGTMTGLDKSLEKSAKKFEKVLLEEI